MFFSKVTILAVLSLATNNLVSAQGSVYGALYAREASPESYGYLAVRDTDIYARDAYPEAYAEASEALIARKKGPKVTVSLSKNKGGDKNKWGSNKNKETESDGVDLVTAACEKHNWAGAVITAAFHVSGGETEKHVDFIPTGKSDTAHVTKSGKVTIGAGGKGALRRRSLSERDLDILDFHRRSFLEAREAYADALEAIL